MLTINKTLKVLASIQELGSNPDMVNYNKMGPDYYQPDFYIIRHKKKLIFCWQLILLSILSKQVF